MPENLLYYGDNLDILRHYIDDESIDLIYLDPPFKSSQDYNILFAEKNGSQSTAQIKAFEDTWHWDLASVEAYEEIVIAGGKVSEVMQAFRTFLGNNDMMAYLSMMAPRLVELKRVLKNTGSIYLHCDSTASHYLKLLMDAIFGVENFRNEIIWRRTANNKSMIRFGPIHQTILFYSKSNQTYFKPLKEQYTKEFIENNYKYKDERGRYRQDNLTGPGIRKGDSGKEWRGVNPTNVGRHWQPATYLYTKYKELTNDDLSKYSLLERFDKLDEIGLIHWPRTEKGSVPRYKIYLSDETGPAIQDLWAYQPGTKGTIYESPDVGIDEDVKWLSTFDKERLGYPTQKPEGLLERIINASSKENDIILDPFCGCGTTIAVAQQLNRYWIGIDITHLAIALIKHRLHDAFDNKIHYKVFGEPVTLPDAKILAEQDKYQFQWWALSRVNARPTPTEQKKGRDRGIDGRLYFFEKPGQKQPKQIILSVKGGKVSVIHIRDLRGVVEREKASIGVYISLNEPTRDMRKESAEAGFYTPQYGLEGKKYPKIQLLTIKELFEGKTIDCPPYYRSGGNVTFKKAQKVQKEKEKKGKQKTLH